MSGSELLSVGLSFESVGFQSLALVVWLHWILHSDYTTPWQCHISRQSIHCIKLTSKCRHRVCTVCAMWICTLVTTLVLFWTRSEMYFEWLECKSTPAQLIWCHWDWLVTPVSNLTLHTTLSWTQLYWYISFHLIIVLITILLWLESIDGQNNFLHDISYFGNHSPGWLSLFGFTIIITCARCDHPRHNPCTMPIALQTDDCNASCQLQCRLTNAAANMKASHWTSTPPMIMECTAMQYSMSNMQNVLRIPRCNVHWNINSHNASHETIC